MQHDYAHSLPEADAESAAHSDRCAAYIRERIHDAGGSISFAEFMHYALYAPGLGYYAAGSRKFGAAGDFVTAPEISPVFARVIARQCAGVLENIDGGSVLEFGAGTGSFAVHFLDALAAHGALPDTYRIVEVSADLRERQQALIESARPDVADRVTWLDRMPEAHEGVIVANEVLDALPVERFLRRTDGVRQLRVAEELGEFVFVDEPAPDVLAIAVESIEYDLGHTLPPGYMSEVSLSAPAWIRELGNSLSQGLALLFDYGVSRREYYALDRNEGWLRCHFRHRAHSDPLILPGIQDVTAWVDFSSVAAAAAESGLDVAGYVTQTHFLVGGGLDREIRAMTNLPPESQLDLANQIKMLTLPGEMGENVKCMGLSRGAVSAVAAFGTSDRTHTL